MLLKSSCVTPVDCRATHKRVEASPDHMAKARPRLDTLGIHSIEAAGKSNTTVPAHHGILPGSNIHFLIITRGIRAREERERERERRGREQEIRKERMRQHQKQTCENDKRERERERDSQRRERCLSYSDA